MKRNMKLGLALFFTVFVAPVWAHHAAEGIISDDIWEMIDDNLEAVDSPHLNIDFDAVIDSMRVGTTDTGAPALITEVEVRADEIDLYETSIDALIESWLVELVEANEIPPSILNEDHGGWFYFETEDLGDDYYLIRLVEPIGGGAGQDVLNPSDPPANGKGS